jgi:hypothetical protein
MAESAKALGRRRRSPWSRGCGGCPPRRNDGAVAAHLLGEITSGNHAFAIGLVQGFVGARNTDTHERIDEAWEKFHRLEPIWA